MMSLDRDTLKHRFEGLKPKAASSCFAQREAVEMTCDEDQFNAELAQVMVSIAALTSALPATEALTDERVRRMMLALEGFSSPYLKTRFKQEATPKEDGSKQQNKEIRVETRAPSRFRHASRRPTERAASAITTKFLRVKDEPKLEIMPLVPGMPVFAQAALQLQMGAPRPL